MKKMFFVLALLVLAGGVVQAKEDNCEVKMRVGDAVIAHNFQGAQCVSMGNGEDADKPARCKPASCEKFCKGTCNAKGVCECTEVPGGPNL